MLNEKIGHPVFVKFVIHIQNIINYHLLQYKFNPSKAIHNF